MYDPNFSNTDVWGDNSSWSSSWNPNPSSSYSTSSSPPPFTHLVTADYQSSYIGLDVFPQQHELQSSHRGQQQPQQKQQQYQQQKQQQYRQLHQQVQQHHPQPQRFAAEDFIDVTSSDWSNAISAQQLPQQVPAKKTVSAPIQDRASPVPPPTPTSTTPPPTSGAGTNNNNPATPDNANADGANGGVIEDQLNSQSLYKTELCRSFQETRTCRYGLKCQFAHGKDELRPVLRHPKYKTEICRTFHSTGTCPYGKRCRFIHQSADESNQHAINIIPYSKANGAGSEEEDDLVVGMEGLGIGSSCSSSSPCSSRPSASPCADEGKSSKSSKSKSVAVWKDDKPKKIKKRLPFFAILSADPASSSSSSVSSASSH